MNPDSTNDGGLGVVDNGMFICATRFLLGSPTVARHDFDYDCLYPLRKLPLPLARDQSRMCHLLEYS